MTRRFSRSHGYDGNAARKRDFAPVKNVLAGTLRRYGLDKEIARYEWVLHWEEIVGEEIAKRSKPEYMRGKTLVIRVTDSSWAQELSFHKEVILKRLKKHLQAEELLNDVFFYVGPLR